MQKTNTLENNMVPAESIEDKTGLVEITDGKILA